MSRNDKGFAAAFFAGFLFVGIFDFVWRLGEHDLWSRAGAAPQWVYLVIGAFGGIAGYRCALKITTDHEQGVDQ